MRLIETVRRQPEPSLAPRRSMGRTRGVAWAAAAVLVASGTVWWADQQTWVAPSADMEPALLRPGTRLRAQEVLALEVGDTDGDGLSDAQEAVLETLAHVADSDGDGFSDSEELARHSDPLDPGSSPVTTVSSAGLTARGEGGSLRLVLCVHEPAQQGGDALVRLGVSAAGQVMPVPIDRLALSGNVVITDGSNGSSLTCIDVSINPAFIHAYGFVSFFVAAGSKSSQVLESAGKIDILSDGQTLFLQTTPSATLASQQVGQGGATIRRPIPVVLGPPPESSWIAGAVCFQRSEVIGVNGPRLLHQIVEADCVQGWDTFCSGDCTAVVGDTYETIDPWSLIGG